MKPFIWGGRSAVSRLLIAWLMAASMGSAQTGPYAPPLSRTIAVELKGTIDTRVIFLAPDGSERSAPLPVTAALRPGHRYALAMIVPGHAQERCYGTIEVLALAIPPTADVRKFPVPIVFDLEDLSAVLGGTMVTKVLVLEDPRQADNHPAGDEPFVERIPPGDDPIQRARRLGLPVLVVRLGTRVPTREELAGGSVPETCPRVAHPEESKGVSAATPFQGVPPRWTELAQSPESLACIRNGGAGPTTATVGGFGPAQPTASDAVAEYADHRGRRRVACSNPVCILSPRFVEVRQLLAAEGIESRWLAGTLEQAWATDRRETASRQSARTQYGAALGYHTRARASAFRAESWDGSVTEIRRLEGVESGSGWATRSTIVHSARMSHSGRSQSLDLHQLAEELSLPQFPQVAGTAAGVGEAVAAWADHAIRTVEESPRPPGCIHLEKSASASQAAIGEEIEFVIRYENVGGRVVENLAVIDSLSARIEYVPESAQSSRDAIFTLEPNEVGSHLLRWEIRQPLAPKESGTVRFRARIR